MPRNTVGPNKKNAVLEGIVLFCIYTVARCLILIHTFNMISLNSTGSSFTFRSFTALRNSPPKLDPHLLSTRDDSDSSLYGYTPTESVCITFVALFGASTGTEFIQLFGGNISHEIYSIAFNTVYLFSHMVDVCNRPSGWNRRGRGMDWQTLVKPEPFSSDTVSNPVSWRHIGIRFYLTAILCIFF